jgi:hypothetical protein
MSETFDADWKDMDDAPRDGTEILVARNNGCGWEYYLVWWTMHTPSVYPWIAEFNAYPEDEFSAWKYVGKPPYEIE